MDTPSIIILIAFGIFIWIFLNRTMKIYLRRKEGTGREVDLATIGRRGHIEPDTITKIERELKEQANEEQQN